MTLLTRNLSLRNASRTSTISHLQQPPLASTTITPPPFPPYLPASMTSSQPAFVSLLGRAPIANQRHASSIPCISSSLSSVRSTSFFPPRLAHRRLSSPRFLPLAENPSTRHLSPVHSISAQKATPSQQETDWNEVRVLGVTKHCEDHTLLRVNVGVTFSLGSLTDAYRVPGMYLQLRPSLDNDDGVKPAFLAISSPPTISGIFEFLIKDSDSTKWVSSLKEGDVVYSSPVAGKGFRFSSLNPLPDNVLLFATGSGIAPIRAVIESPLNGIEPNKRRSVTLFYGARTPQRMAYMDKFDEWRSNNVKVVPVISQPDKAEDGWTGSTGYVQHALDDIGISDPANTAAVLCGLKGMTEEVKSRLISAGVPEEHILFNF